MKTRPLHGRSRVGPSARAALAAAGAIAWSAAASSAEMVSLPMHVFDKSPGAATAGLDLQVAFMDSGSTGVFVVSNQSTVPSVITSVYFEATPFMLEALTGGAIVTPQLPGISFSAGASPPKPPGSIAALGGAWAGSLFSMDADSPGPSNGIGPGELSTVRFTIRPGFDGGDVQDAMQSNPVPFRIAAHVQALSGGGSAWVSTTIVPAPGLATAATAGAAVLAVRRRRMPAGPA